MRDKNLGISNFKFLSVQKFENQGKFKIKVSDEMLLEKLNIHGLYSKHFNP